jgi:hypothetical protein
MTAQPVDMTNARRELVIVAMLIVGMARLVERPDAFLVAALLPVVMLVAGAAMLRTDELPGRPFEALLIPAVLAGGAAAAIQLVPAGLLLVPVLGGFALGLDRVLVHELRLAAQAQGASDSDRYGLLVGAVLTAFVAFIGMAALVPGGLPEPGTSSAGLSEGWLVVLAVDDALVALLLGYRVASARYGSARDALRSAVTYAIVIAVAAGALRAMDVPRLVGPAALTLVFYLWDALHATSPARRREPRFLWETVLLAAIAVAVVAWNLRLRA